MGLRFHLEIKEKKKKLGPKQIIVGQFGRFRHQNLKDQKNFRLNSDVPGILLTEEYFNREPTDDHFDFLSVIYSYMSLKTSLRMYLKF